MKLKGKRQFPAPQRILLVQLRRIGDTLLGTPAIRALHAKFPSAKIDFMVERPADEVLAGHPLLDRLLVVPTTSGVEWLKSIRELRSERYDWTIDFMSNPRSAQYAWLSGAKTRVGFDRRGRRWAYTHRAIEETADRDAYAVDLRLEMLRQIGVEDTGRALEIFSDNVFVDEAARANAAIRDIAQQNLIAVATGSANAAKRYPADLTAEVIAGLQKEGYKVILTAGPGESQFAREILKQGAVDIVLLEDARVPTLAALYRKCKLYVGPDSGPKHVAVACGIPTVTIFGPGKPSNWNDPRSETNVLLTSPCELRPYCVESECARREDLRKIAPEEIVRAALRLLR